MVVGLGFACHEFGFCSQWWGLWVAAFGVDGGLVLVYPLHFFFFFFFFGVDGQLWIVDFCGLLVVVVVVSVDLWWFLYRKNERENK